MTGVIPKALRNVWVKYDCEENPVREEISDIE
jgi:hypothetical protein